MMWGGTEFRSQNSARWTESVEPENVSPGNCLVETQNKFCAKKGRGKASNPVYP